MSHYYRKDGTPAHFEGKNGNATTLREARKLGLFPSVTTVQSILDKPALNNWWMEQVALQAITTWLEIDGDWDDVDQESLVKSAIAAAKQKVYDKADAGSEMHDYLEMFFLGAAIQLDYPPYVYNVDALLYKNCGDQVWIPEQSFCHVTLGYGGKCDLHSPEWIVDFKTKDGNVEGKRGYPNEAEQLAAYAHGLGLFDARLANVYISRDDGSVAFYEHTDPNAWNRFYHTLALWQNIKRYGPLYVEK